jgi:hypothetical protein
MGGFANIGGRVPPPRQWWAFYVPAALFAAMGCLFVVCNERYGSSDASRAGVWGLFGFAAAWLVGAIHYTGLHFRRKEPRIDP